MRYLIAFLVRNRIFLLFLLLQVIAFSFTFQSRSFQRSSMMNSASQISGGILESFSNYQQFLDLENQNQILLEENARLRSLKEDAFLPSFAKSYSQVDSFYQNRYTYINANVINSSYLKARNYLTLNKGSLQGIKSGMGVIGSHGAVGKVYNVSKNFCTVIPIINSNYSVISGAFAKDEGQFGPIEWKGRNYRFATLLDIPKQTPIKAGDSISTYKNSQIYPPGIPIGVVESFQLQSDQTFYSVKIKLNTDFSTLKHVYIVKDNFRLELENLENQNG